jgi:hypothetical protein
MGKNRMEAFSDGVLAIIITVMVLEMKAPQGVDLAALRPVLPVFLGYVLSFVYLGIYWNNHHHILHATQRVSGAVLWELPRRNGRARRGAIRFRMSLGADHCDVSSHHKVIGIGRNHMGPAKS